MQHYLMVMTIMLIIPALLSHYICPIQRLLDKPEDGNRGDNSVLVWIVFGFCVWLAHSNFENNAKKWELCQTLAEHRIKQPEACWESEEDSYDDRAL
ncbi:MAG: hypothetical protein IIB68_11150 [Proteobacteria bacterium]|nr:hypothetical protein [Pseudomonadota bacterium]